MLSNLVLTLPLHDVASHNVRGKYCRTYAMLNHTVIFLSLNEGFRVYG